MKGVPLRQGKLAERNVAEMSENRSHLPEFTDKSSPSVHYSSAHGPNVQALWETVTSVATHKKGRMSVYEYPRCVALPYSVRVCAMTRHGHVTLRVIHEVYR